MDEPKTTHLLPPNPLWSEGTKHRAGHRHSGWSSRELTVDEEHAAVQDALRQETVAIWRDLYQSREAALARVKELEIEGAPAPPDPGSGWNGTGALPLGRSQTIL